MRNLQSWCSVMVVAAVVGAAGCSVEASTEEASSADLDGLDPSDEGTNYNGWTQFLTYDFDRSFQQINSITHTLSRSSGDATRGGGGCLVVQQGMACSSDSTCTTTAQSLYGAGAYGYCYQGASCLLRPGSQASYCALNPNRSPGALTQTFSSLYKSGMSWFVLGCMTKTAGPNTACGGTNASLYMRSVSYIY
jgi:hypothetical protein